MTIYPPPKSWQVLFYLFSSFLLALSNIYLSDSNKYNPCVMLHHPYPVMLPHTHPYCWIYYTNGSKGGKNRINSTTFLFFKLPTAISPLYLLPQHPYISQIYILTKRNCNLFVSPPLYFVYF